jgi:hypothetical protein
MARQRRVPAMIENPIFGSKNDQARWYLKVAHRQAPALRLRTLVRVKLVTDEIISTKYDYCDNIISERLFLHAYR